MCAVTHRIFDASFATQHIYLGLSAALLPHSAMMLTTALLLALLGVDGLPVLTDFPSAGDNTLSAGGGGACRCALIGRVRSV